MVARYSHTPPYPTKPQQRDKRLWEIMQVMTKFELERAKACILPTDRVPEQWRREAEAAAIYDLFVPKD